jgi:hypothetical protein
MLRYVSNQARRTTIVDAPLKQTGPRANPYYTAQISVTEQKQPITTDPQFVLGCFAGASLVSPTSGAPRTAVGNKFDCRHDKGQARVARGAWRLDERRGSKCHPVPPIAVRDKTALQTLCSVLPKWDMLWVKYLYGDVRGLGNVPLSGTRFHAPCDCPTGHRTLGLFRERQAKR